MGMGTQWVRVLAFIPWSKGMRLVAFKNLPTPPFSTGFDIGHGIKRDPSLYQMSIFGGHVMNGVIFITVIITYFRNDPCAYATVYVRL